MRVIAGLYKGLTIPLPKGGDIRPTTDRAKEALFSILTNRYDVSECTVLDLFGGSGNVSFEFLSRGCNQITFVEKNQRVSKQAEAFAESKDISGIKFTTADVFAFIKRTSKKFDIIFADPPYNLYNISEIPTLVREKGLLKSKGTLIIEHDSKLQWDSSYLVESRPYGQSVFSMFQFDVSLNK
ncbi:MAG: 16S rRNA (guanine966-N2)-methyltransferase [Bacteroidia bacterium]|jgi:16S rRNA (guanine966-N2)-methyltransferase